MYLGRPPVFYCQCFFWLHIAERYEYINIPLKNSEIYHIIIYIPAPVTDFSKPAY